MLDSGSGGSRIRLEPNKLVEKELEGTVESQCTCSDAMPVLCEWGCSVIIYECVMFYMTVRLL